jgi:aminopeptidase YwaD
MKKIAVMMAGLAMMSAFARGQKPPLLPEKEVAALADELSGEAAKRNLEGIARFHRQRGSKGFHEAAELVAERLRAYGLSDVAILEFPADGKIFYGTQRSRPAWDAEFAELWETKDGGVVRLASYEAEPVVLAEDSESADVTAELVDVGTGDSEGDYAGKEPKGKIVLVSAQPGAVQELAVGKFGAAGIVSYAQNQKTAWSGENLDAIRWGHLETFSANKTFGFMVSLRTARDFQERLTKGDKITLHAVVKAGQHEGNYEVVTATIPGADAKLKEEEIAFSCHLDHQRPGANDNASGCATILEVARTLQKLIGEGKLARPARTIRFVFPPEIEGTLALLNGKPEMAKRIKAAIHMDMVGGGPETKAVFHVTRGPMSLPSFVHDVAWAFAEWLNEESYEYAATGKAEYPLISAAGGREPLGAEYSAYTMGSDHDVYQDSSIGIPAIYLNDWPDRYIHTNLDTAANIDATKLKRAAFIGAASGYFLAALTEKSLPELHAVVQQGDDLQRAADEPRLRNIPEDESACAPDIRAQMDWSVEIEIAMFLHAEVDKGRSEAHPKVCELERSQLNGGNARFVRQMTLHGPLVVFGYDYFEANWARLGHPTKPRLLEYQGLWGSGEEYAYEVLNFVDGVISAQQIRDRVSLEYGPVPLELVLEYLKGLEEIGVVKEMK